MENCIFFKFWKFKRIQLPYSSITKLKFLRQIIAFLQNYILKSILHVDSRYAMKESLQYVCYSKHSIVKS